MQILEYEPLAKKQVPLLLKLGEQKAALLKATQSGDTDLVFLVLLYLKEKMGSADYQVCASFLCSYLNVFFNNTLFL